MQLIIDMMNDFDWMQTEMEPIELQTSAPSQLEIYHLLTALSTDPQDKPNNASEVVKHENDENDQDYNQPRDVLQVDIPEGSVVSEPNQDIIAEPRRRA